MAEYTPNYSLEKATENEYYDVSVHARNMDKIDEALKAHDDALATKETPQGAQAKANAAENAAKQYADQRVNALAGEGNTKTVKQIDDELASHLAEDVTQGDNPHGLIYEEGIWTPSISGNYTGGTYSTQKGEYLRINDRCFVRFVLEIDEVGTGTHGIAIKGFPFSRSNEQSVYVNMRTRGMDMTGCIDSFGKINTYGSFIVYLLFMAEDGSAFIPTISKLQKGTTIFGSFNYLIA